LVDKKGALDSIARYLGVLSDSLKLITPPGQAPIATPAPSVHPPNLTYAPSSF